MEMIEYFSNSKIQDVARIMFSLLDRLPIVFMGDDDFEVEEILNETVSLISFRNPMIFYTDFVNEEELNQILENEEIDYDVERNIFVCYPFALKKCLERFSEFNNWVLGYSQSTNDQKSLKTLLKRLNNSSRCFLKIKIQKGKLQTRFENPPSENINLDLEEILYLNAIERTEIAVEKIRRVVSKRIKRLSMEEDLIEDILNFSLEEKHLKENLIKREILDFYEASKRAFSLLNRLKSLKDFGFSAKISPKTLFNTIAFEEISIHRLIQFIKAEWDVDYNSFFENNKISKFMDKIESLWG